MRFLFPIGVIVFAVAGAMLAVQGLHEVFKRFGRSSLILTELAGRVHRPAQAVVATAAVYVALREATAPAHWRAVTLHLLRLLVIASVAWLAGRLLVVAEDVALARWRTDVSDNLRARRVHTQVVMLRRVTLVVAAVLAFGVMLTTFPAARVVGTSVL